MAVVDRRTSSSSSCQAQRDGDDIRIDSHDDKRIESKKKKDAPRANDLKDCVCLVMGASRGIGKGVAIELGQAGATVYVTGTSSSSIAANHRLHHRHRPTLRRSWWADPERSKRRRSL